jgi:hypothetical protein
MKRLTSEEDIVVSTLVSVESHIENIYIYIVLNMSKWTLTHEFRLLG